MVRFQLKRASDDKSPQYFPYYKDSWTSSDPSSPDVCESHGWSDIWEHDSERDRLHRKNSFYYSREIEGEEELEETPTLAIILFGSILFCLFVPQIIDLLITVFCPGPLPPPSPPTPPPGPKCRKQLRLFHYAEESKKERKKKTSSGIDYYYDPDNILNYVSATRIRTLRELEGEDADDESDHPHDEVPRKRKSRHSKVVPSEEGQV